MRVRARHAARTSSSTASSSPPRRPRRRSSGSSPSSPRDRPSARRSGSAPSALSTSTPIRPRGAMSPRTPKPGWAAHCAGAPCCASASASPSPLTPTSTRPPSGEHRWGAGRDVRVFCYLTVGTGIGAGLVIDGRPVHGLVHPEVGHLRVPHDRDRDPFAGHLPVHGDCWEGLACGPGSRRALGHRARGSARRSPGLGARRPTTSPSASSHRHGRLAAAGRRWAAGSWSSARLLALVRTRLRRARGRLSRHAAARRRTSTATSSRPRSATTPACSGRCALASGGRPERPARLTAERPH